MTAIKIPHIHISGTEDQVFLGTVRLPLPGGILLLLGTVVIAR